MKEKITFKSFPNTRIIAGKHIINEEKYIFIKVIKCINIKDINMYHDYKIHRKGNIAALITKEISFIDKTFNTIAFFAFSDNFEKFKELINSEEKTIKVKFI